MADEWGYTIKNTNNYQYDYEQIFNHINSFIGEYKIEDMIKIIGVDFGINLFDLFLLKKFIEENNITHMMELGAGSSSKFIDSLGIKRTSFALDSVFYDLDYVKLNIKDDYEIVQEHIRKNDFDMFFIDNDHSTEMAKLICDKFLNLMDYSKPLFIHDWFDFNKTTYSEQVYYYNNMLDKYDVEYMTDLPDVFINSLKQKSNKIDNRILYHTAVHYVPRCSIILKPKNG